MTFKQKDSRFSNLNILDNGSDLGDMTEDETSDSKSPVRKSQEKFDSYDSN